MLAILRKEISAFFGSLTGYLSMAVFFVFLGLNLFVFDGNIFDGGYATLDSFFGIAPWISIFLISALTMRSFADEQQRGTLELLATKPLSDTQIVLGKYLGAIVLWLFIFTPTLLYFVSLSVLDLPNAPIDSGATIGSYAGLFLLGLVFIAIGLFSSSLTANPIVAFLLSVFLGYFMYDAFFRLSTLPFFSGRFDYMIQSLGLGAHYDSISRGVVDTRDLIYFISIAALFLLGTRTALESRKW